MPQSVEEYRRPATDEWGSQFVHVQAGLLQHLRRIDSAARPARVELKPTPHGRWARAQCFLPSRKVYVVSTTCYDGGGKTPYARRKARLAKRMADDVKHVQAHGFRCVFLDGRLLNGLSRGLGWASSKLRQLIRQATLRVKDSDVRLVGQPRPPQSIRSQKRRYERQRTRESEFALAA